MSKVRGTSTARSFSSLELQHGPHSEPHTGPQVRWGPLCPLWESSFPQGRLNQSLLFFIPLRLLESLSQRDREVFIAEQMLSRLLSKRTGHIATLSPAEGCVFYGKGLVVEVLGRMPFGVGVGATSKMRGGPGWQWESRGLGLGSES